MGKGYQRLDTEETSDKERERVLKAQQREQKRIKYDRFRVIAALFLIVVVAFCATCVGICVVDVMESRMYQHRAAVEYHLSLILLNLIEETTASVQYVENSENVEPDREEEAYIQKYQTSTQEAITIASDSSNGCEICSSVLGLVDLENLLFIERNVLRRTYTPLSCLTSFKSVTTGLSRAMNYFLGYTLRDGVVDIVWFQNILLGVRSVGMIVPGIMQGDISQDLMQSMYYDVSTCLAALDNINSNSYALSVVDEDMQTSYQNAVNDAYTSGQAVLDKIDVDMTGISVVQTSMSPLEALQSLEKSFRGLLDALEDSEPWLKNNLTLDIVTLITCAVAILLSIVCIVLLLYSALSIIWVSPESLYGMRHQERVDSSLERMEFFVERVYDLDLEGVEYAAQRSAESKSITSAERDLLRLAPKLINVLAFLNPNLYTFRQNWIKDSQSSDIVLAEEESISEQATNPFGAGALQAIEVDRGTDSGPSMDDRMSNASTMIVPQRDDGLMITGLAETKLVSQSVCFILVDISCFYDEVTPETSKILPVDISNCIAQVMKLVRASGGNYITTTGSIVITAFNEAEVHDAENTCVMVLVSIQTHILPTYPGIRCAVISSIVPQGIIGSPSLKTFLTDGDVLHFGELLIRIARLHNATFVVDTGTFMKIDTQYFYKLALEEVGIEESDTASTITVYELVPHGRDTSAYLWNEAFDQFHAGEYDQAKEKLRLWERQHGTTKSWKRFYSLLNAKPRPRPVTYLFSSNSSFEPDFFLS